MWLRRASVQMLSSTLKRKSHCKMTSSCSLDQINHLKSLKNPYTIAPKFTYVQDQLLPNQMVRISPISGEIVQICDRFEGAEIDVELNDQILLPGFVNSHSHIFQTALRGKGETYAKVVEEGNANEDSFWSWREEMYSLVAVLEKDPQRFYQIAKTGFEEMLRKGITTVGEFHYFHHHDAERNYGMDQLILQAAKDVGIRIVLLNAFYKYAGFGKAPLNPTQASAFQTQSLQEYWKQMDHLQTLVQDNSMQTLGVVAHSLRAVDVEDLVPLHEESVKRQMVFHLHLEEQRKEVEDCQQAHSNHTPMAMLLKTLNLDDKFTSVHCTFTKPDELKQYASTGANVCICPLTEGNLGDGIPSLDSIPSNSICIGSDCNARIDFLEELRWLEYTQRLFQSRRGICAFNNKQPHIYKELIKYGTKNGGKALNLPIGEIREGAYADFALVNFKHPELNVCQNNMDNETIMNSMLFGGAMENLISATCVHGKWHTFDTTTKKSRDDTTGSTDTADPTVAVLEAKNVVELAQAFINIESLSGNEVKMALAVKTFLEAHNYQHIVLQPVEPEANNVNYGNKPRFNLFAMKSKNKNARLIFNTHLDTVPPYFGARKDEVNIYGRGACDTKSLLASQLYAMEMLPEHIREEIGLLYVVSEETNHSGMIKANELGLTPEFMIVAEPTALKLMRLQKGILKLVLKKKGVAAHSGYPELGESAIDPMVDVLSDLKAFNWPKSSELGDTTLNIGLISGGQAVNALAEEAEAHLMFRVTIDPMQLLQTVQGIVADRVEVNVVTKNSPVKLGVLSAEQDPHNIYETDVASFNTDIPYFNFPQPGPGEKEAMAFLYGPGDIKDAHCEREYIRIADLEKSVKLYSDLAETLLKS